MDQPFDGVRILDDGDVVFRGLMYRSPGGEPEICFVVAVDGDEFAVRDTTVRRLGEEAGVTMEATLRDGPP